MKMNYQLKDEGRKNIEAITTFIEGKKPKIHWRLLKVGYQLSLKVGRKDTPTFSEGELPTFTEGREKRQYNNFYWRWGLIEQ